MESNENSTVSSFFLIIVIITGLFGNTLNMIIFSQKPMRKNSTFRYLFYLSVIDILVIIFCATETLLTHGFRIKVKEISTYTSKISTFMEYFLTHESSIVLMIVSIDRTLVVCNKSLLFFNFLRRIISQSMNKARYVGKLITFISLVLGLMNFHHLVFGDLTEVSSSKALPLNLTTLLKELKNSTNTTSAVYDEIKLLETSYSLDSVG